MYYYLVVDLEATCWEHQEVPRTEMETIEIGAVLCSGRDFTILREFQTFIRPQRHPSLSPFCTKLTTIQNQDLLNAPSFPEALLVWRSFIAPLRPIFCSWGAYDWGQLLQDVRYHKVALPDFQERLNLKDLFQKRARSHRPMGMAAALKRAELPLIGTHHRGIDDARNIAALLPYAIGEKPLKHRDS